MIIPDGQDWGGMSASAYRHFGRICRATRDRTGGISWEQLRDARSLAIALAAGDGEGAQELAGSLGVDMRGSLVETK